MLGTKRNFLVQDSEDILEFHFLNIRKTIFYRDEFRVFSKQGFRIKSWSVVELKGL